jgi:Mn2+/Fe2+ NRAMP family transporter
MDRFALAMGFVMVGLTWYVAVVSHPPLADAVVHSFVPERIDPLAIVTIVGGTVGGYITFAGAHRLLDAGVTGRSALGDVTSSALTAIGIASLMRIVLFLAALGVVARGLTLDPGNPAASVFHLATGQAGYRLFGVVMWAAAITSVVGSAYTSVSFLRGLGGDIVERHRSRVIIAFIAISAAIFVWVGRPVKLLILVGALNGLILPISLAVMLVAAYRRSVVGEYAHPWALTALGVVAAGSMAVMGVWTLTSALPALIRG